MTRTTANYITGLSFIRSPTCWLPYFAWLCLVLPFMKCVSKLIAWLSYCCSDINLLPLSLSLSSLLTATRWNFLTWVLILVLNHTVPLGWALSAWWLYRLYWLFFLTAQIPEQYRGLWSNQSGWVVILRMKKNRGWNQPSPTSTRTGLIQSAAANLQLVIVDTKSQFSKCSTGVGIFSSLPGLGIDWLGLVQLFTGHAIVLGGDRRNMSSSGVWREAFLA